MQIPEAESVTVVDDVMAPESLTWRRQIVCTGSGSADTFNDEATRAAGMAVRNSRRVGIRP